MFCIRTEFCTPSSDVSTVLATKPKGKEDLYTTAVMSIYIQQKKKYCSCLWNVVKVKYAPYKVQFLK
jgi:hypothetical protein